MPSGETGCTSRQGEVLRALMASDKSWKGRFETTVVEGIGRKKQRFAQKETLNQWANG